MARDSKSGSVERATKVVRVAIYTRKSTEEGLDQEFNTLDAQRQAIEAYIESQRGEGWVALPDRYDDGGFTGANTNRPAFQRLLQDIKDGKVDAVAVYKIDRLSRSLFDFSSIINYFDKHGVSFTSITQQFNSATSMGKLTLNILMSFAEFEREVISERTRDKMAATRRKGMWTGGKPPLGYDVVDKKLVVNEDETERVRKIFQLYLQLGSLLSVVMELKDRGWTNKTWLTQKGHVHQGSDFDKNSVRLLLINPLFIGKMPYKDELHDGRHDAIVDTELWDAVQEKLKSHCHGRGNNPRNKWDALLKGIAQCGVCGAALGIQATRKGNRHYLFYVCQTAQKLGASACPGSRVSAKDIEGFVVERIKDIGRNPDVLVEACKAARKYLKEQRPKLAAKVKRLSNKKQKLEVKRKNLVDAVEEGDAPPSLVRRLGEVDEAMKKATLKLDAARQELACLDDDAIDEDDLKAALESFTPVWSELFPKERARIVRLLVERVTYNAEEGKVTISYRSEGVGALASEAEEVLQ